MANDTPKVGTTAFNRKHYTDVDHPLHYNQYSIEVIDLTERLPFTLGNVFKYLLRAPFKGKKNEDISKALWYFDRFSYEDLTGYTPRSLCEVTYEMIHTLADDISSKKMTSKKEIGLYGTDLKTVFHNIVILLKIIQEQQIKDFSDKEEQPIPNSFSVAYSMLKEKIRNQIATIF